MPRSYVRKILRTVREEEMGPNYEAYTVRVLTFEDGRGAKHRLRFYQAGEEKRFRTWRKAGGRTPERQAARRRAKEKKARPRGRLDGLPLGRFLWGRETAGPPGGPKRPLPCPEWISRAGQGR